MLYKNRKRHNLVVCAKGYWLMPTQINPEEDRKRATEKNQYTDKMFNEYEGQKLHHVGVMVEREREGARWFTCTVLAFS